MKKLTMLFLALLMILSMSACSNKTIASAVTPVATTSTATWQEKYDLGVHFLTEGNYEEAILAFTAAIGIDPKRADAYIGRGDSYVQLSEQLDLAQPDYEKAIELEANSAAYLGLADVYIRRGDYDKALETLREGLEKTGNDSSITEKIAEIEKGIITDSFGNIRRMNAYDADGNLIWFHEYTYKNRRQSGVTAYDEDGNQTGHVDILYDETGHNLQSYGWNHDDGTISPIAYEYDAAGNIVKMSHFNSDGKMTGYSTYEYDSTGKTDKSTQYEADDTMSGYYTYEYNEAGQEVNCSFFNADGIMDGYSTREYNATGQEVKYAFFNAANEIDWYTTYEYDSAGKSVKETHFNSDGTVQSIYEYD